jgi:ribose 5-phosphate isomerase B
LEQEDIAALVRQVVSRTLGDRPLKTVIGEEMLRDVEPGATFEVPADAIITPLAQQLALEKRVKFSKQGAVPVHRVSSSETQVAGKAADPGRMVALGADHGGYTMKEALKSVVSQAGYSVIDCGTHSTESVDYPDFAYAVAQLVANGQAWRGIIVDGAGIGSCMAANKVPGVRAAMCYDQATAVNSREHNNANVLTLGAGLIGPNLAAQITLTWLKTSFGGGRHARRVDKIDAIGARFMKGPGRRD